ncbi:flippase [Halorubrum ezzemoulense]|uniref:flippase n=1 Tax=Halorubrum ezzemoulense TaxID=337243 RepID=UPI00232D8A35|nr:flippase [Halorubrum ezzemoulense]MDB2276124.1 flippase [Halorubrum ezzemoulense]
MSIIKAASKLFAANVLGSVLGFLGIALFARQIGATQLGIYFLFQAVVGICAIGADFGISSALKKRISEGKSQGKYLFAAILLKFIFLVIVSALILLLRGYLSDYIGADIAYLLILTLFVQQYADIFINTLHGEIRVGETAHIKVIQRIVWIITGLIITYYNPTATGLIQAHIIGASSRLVISWYLKDITVSIPETKQIQSVFDYSKFSVISSVGGYLYSWLDVLIIGYFLTSDYVAAYEVAWRITSFIVLLSKSVSLTIFPQVSEWSVEDATDEITRVIKDATTVSLVISLPAFFGAAILSSELLLLLFGNEYTIASAALVILMFEKIFQSVHKVWGYSLQAIDRPDQAAVAAVISIIVNILLNILLIPSYDLEGAATATALSFLLNTVLHAYYLQHSIPIQFDRNKIVWSIVSSIVMSVVVYTVSTLAEIESILILLLLISVGVVVYFAILSIYSPIRSDIKSIIYDLQT